MKPLVFFSFGRGRGLGFSAGGGGLRAKATVLAAAVLMAGGLAAASADSERAVPRVKPIPRVAPGAVSGAGAGAGAAELLPPLMDKFAGEVEGSPLPTPSGVGLPPDIPPLGLPSDGETAPSFPDLPELPSSSLLPQLPGDDGLVGGLPGGEETGGEGGDRPPPPVLTPPVEGTVPPPPADSPFPVWHESPTKARALSQAEKKCLLLVFSGAQGEAGGTSKQLSDEVFSQPAFNEFALNHLVICGLFYGKSSMLDVADPAKVARADAMVAIKKAFGVRGFPCVILFGPDGQEIQRWKGYVTGRGRSQSEQIRHAVEGHEAVIFESERRRERLAAKGYRTWTSAKGTPLFARLMEYDAQMALFRDEAGADRKVLLKQLALPDREIITRQRLGKPMPERAVTPAAGAETTLR